MSETAILSCTGLEKSYSQGEIKVDVLKGVDLTVKQGDSLAVIGASGSGKSTLLHLLGGLDDATRGEVSVIGRDMKQLSEKERGILRNQALGFVYQFHHLLPEFTAIENVAMPLLIRGMDTGKARADAGEILKNIGLGTRLHHKPGEMSGGERQRAAIARAMVTKPQCILADEPTGNLDENTAAQVFDVMMKLNHEHRISLIMVTHNLQLAKKFGGIRELRDGVLHNYA